MTLDETQTQNLLLEIKEKLQAFDKRNSIEFSRTSKGVPSWTVKAYAEKLEDALELIKQTDQKLQNQFPLKTSD